MYMYYIINKLKEWFRVINCKKCHLYAFIVLAFTVDKETGMKVALIAGWDGAKNETTA